MEFEGARDSFLDDLAGIAEYVARDSEYYAAAW